jgi:hypothetical protein
MISGSVPQRGLSSGIVGGSTGGGAALRTNPNPVQQLALQAALQQQMLLQAAQQQALAQKQKELLAQRKAARQEKRLQAQEKLAAAQEAELQRQKELNALKEERRLVRELEER